MKTLPPAANFCLIALVLMVVDACLPRLLDHSPHPAVVGGAAGVLLGQINLIAVWGAMAALPLLIRIPGSLLLVSCVVGAIVLGDTMSSAVIFGVEFHFNRTHAALAAACFAAQFVGQYPLFLTMEAGGWKLLGPKVNAATMANRQFSVRQLMVAVALWGAVFALGRAVFVQRDQFSSELHQALSSDGLLNAVIIVLCIDFVFLAPLVRRAFRLQAISPEVRGLITGCLTISLLALIPLLSYLIYFSAYVLEFEQIFALLVFALFHALTLGGVLMYLCSLGFRLEQTKSRQER